MAYSPESPPNSLDELRAYVLRELQRISGTFQAGVDAIYLPTLHSEPAKPRNGMIVLADGTDWDPGSGGGYYGYYNSAWQFLG